MRTTFMMTILAIFICLMTSCSGGNDDVAIDTVDQKFSYVMGYEAVGAISSLETVTIDEAAFIKGIRDAFQKSPPLLTQQQGFDIKALVFEEERIFRNQEIMKDAGENLSEQTAFLEQNKGREGIMTTGSGLQYQILEKGDGPSPPADGYARILSRAKLIDGTIVTALSTTAEPTFVPVKGKLPFWEEALSLMPTGSHYRFFIPSALAYGDMGNFIDGGCVGPNQLMIIEIELLEVRSSTDFRGNG
ncbi:MAG: FKBP-type peptidyl-prolyl cis-trans isomerase N-terminal domain-containing protein [Thermodesulfobacteriota bacterium]